MSGTNTFTPVCNKTAAPTTASDLENQILQELQCTQFPVAPAYYLGIAVLFISLCRTYLYVCATRLMNVLSVLQQLRTSAIYGNSRAILITFVSLDALALVLGSIVIARLGKNTHANTTNEGGELAYLSHEGECC